MERGSTIITLELREELKQWIKPGESVRKRRKTQQSAGKVIASVFWDAHGSTTLRKEGRLLKHYAASFDRLVVKIRKSTL